MSKPAELFEAETIDALCQRWSCPPSVVLAEDTAYVLQMMELLRLGNGR